MNRRLYFFLAAVFVWLSIPGEFMGQATSSAISGMVRDPSQAVIAGATVTVTNAETGVSRTRDAGAQGRYRIGELQPGTYQVTVKMPGFATQSHKGLVLQVGQEQTLNFTMQVGAVEQTVEVTGAAPLVETATASVASNVSQEQLRELPLNGRSFVDLARLQPGTNAPSNTTSTGPSRIHYGNGPQLSVSGARTDANNFMIDGTDMNAISNNTPGSAAGVQLGVDTIREYQVITSNAKAEYGRNSGGIINAVSRSGTNDWHGSAFEFLRNSALDARNFFNRKSVLPLRRNQFGATLGGPIKKDKTFFFMGYEGLQNRLGRTNVWTVPTLAARQGIGILNPGESVDPRVVPYLNLYPSPNRQDLGGGVAEFIDDVSDRTGENFGSVRIDHNFSGSDFLFGRYTTSHADIHEALALLSDADFATSNHYLTLQEDHIFSPSLLNMFRVGFNYSLNDYVTEDVPNALALSFGVGRPMGSLSIGAGFSGIGPNAIADTHQAQAIFQFEDQITYTRGAHIMKFGASLERFRWNSDNPSNFRGSFSFNTLRNFLLAGPSGTGGTTHQPGGVTYRHLRTWLPAFYAQDDYRISPRLTLNLGLRWEFTTGFTDTDNIISYLRRGPWLSTLNDLVLGELYKNHIAMLQPRLGFNWALDESSRTVLSGGFGIYHNQVLHNAMVSYRYQLPTSARGNVSNANATGTFPNVYAFVAAFAAGQGPLVFGVPVQSVETRNFDYYDFKTPTLFRYNMTIQRELPAEVALRVGYIGSLGRHMEREQALNRFPQPVVQADGSLFFPGSPVPQFINPNLGSVLFMGSDANSSYNALAVNLQKRWSQGLMFQASYTYSKSIDDFSNSESNYVGEGRAPMYGLDRSLNRARSAFNIPHAFNLNALYELPLGSGKQWLNSGGVANAILGGWQVAGILTLQQGVPFSVNCGSCSSPGFQFVSSRPNLKPGVDVSKLTEGWTREHYFDTSAFSVPPAGTIGNAGRSLLLGPPLRTVNFTLSKLFNISERTRLQFRSEFFNLLNHTNFRNPSTSVFSSAAGAITPTAGRIDETSTSSREVQFGLKLTF